MAITQSTVLPLKFGLFTISYHATSSGNCLSVRYGDVQGKVPIVRLHSSCLFGESLHALDCECASQLTSTLKLIKQNKSGVVLYSYAEGRGVGLENKIKALELQRTHKLNTVEAFKMLGFSPDVRTYDAEIAALQDLGVTGKIKVATQNPHKLAVLRDAGYEIIKEVHPAVKITKHNIKELLAKKRLLGYHISIDPEVETS